MKKISKKNESEKSLCENNKEYQEQRAVHNFSWSVYRVYFSSAFGLFIPALVLVLFTASQVLLMMTDYLPLTWYEILLS
jgi:hypothetical protein